MQPNKVTSGQVANIVLKTMQTRQIRYCCRAIIAADDADDPNDHAVFSQMQKPEAAWKLANEEERKFVDLYRVPLIRTGAPIGAIRWT